MTGLHALGRVIYSKKVRYIFVFENALSKRLQEHKSIGRRCLK